VLTLALIGLLAAPTPEALPRVPGMRLRLGMEETAMLALGSFAETTVPDAGTMTARKGAARFFGVPGEATCYLEGGRLARVTFDATGVSRSSLDYVDGQLRRMQLQRDCERDDLRERVCDWTGPAIRVHTEMKQGVLATRVDPWPPPSKPAADSLRAGSATAPRGTGSPARSPAAASPAAPRPSPAAARGAAAPPPSRGPASTTAPARDAAAVRAVVTLPETLTISLVSRNSPDVWPRIVSSPQLHYPEAARRESVQGVVWVAALVDPAGQVLDAWVERGLPELDTAALAWVSRCRFAPCERNGAPCRFHVRVAVLFALH
jgi:TonB family protein